LSETQARFRRIDVALEALERAMVRRVLSSNTR
jgi:hypothetical protein